MREFYKQKLKKDLKWKQIIKPLFSLWLLFTLLANVLLIIGSILRIVFEFDVSTLTSVNEWLSLSNCRQGVSVSDQLVSVYYLEQLLSLKWLQSYATSASSMN